MLTGTLGQVEQSCQNGPLELARSTEIFKRALIPLLLAMACLSAIAPAGLVWLMFACFAVALLTASWIDNRSRLIPNRLTYPLFSIGISGNLIATLLCKNLPTGTVGIYESLVGAGVCFGLMLFLFVSNATGGGDVKLATAIGAFLGPQAGVMAIAWCHVLAGVFVLIWLLSRLDAIQLLRDSRTYCTNCVLAGRFLPIACNLNAVGQKRIPMAAFFTLGVVVTQLGYRLW